MPNRSVALWALAAALSGFLFGFDTAVISGAEQAVQAEWSMGEGLHGLAISSALWGTVLGALLGSWPSDRFGRKPTLLWIGVFYAVSALGSAIAWDPYSFMIFRFLGGIAVGASSVAAPAYIAEIASPQWRGRLGVLFQTMIVTGILTAFLSNYALSGMPSDWRYMLGVEIVPAVAFLLAMAFAPESPRWLLQRGHRERAERILARMGEDLTSIETERPEGPRGMSLATFFDGHLRRPIMFAFLLAFFNQLSGINAIIYYAPRIFELTGADNDATLLATVGIGIVNLIFTLAGLLLIDRSGRKRLMLIGSIGYIVSLSVAALGFASGGYSIVAPAIFIFIAAHAIGQGAVIWVYISEIFPDDARATGQSFGTSTHWVFAAALTLVMPAALSTIPPAWIFGFFAAMMVLQLLFVLNLMVETRGRRLEDVAAELITAPRAKPRMP